MKPTNQQTPLCGTYEIARFVFPLHVHFWKMVIHKSTMYYRGPASA